MIDDHHIVFTYCADSLVNGTMTQGDALKRLAIVCVLLLALIAIPLVIKKRMGQGWGGSCSPMHHMMYDAYIN